MSEIATIWDRYVRWLEEQAPPARANLAGAATPGAIAKLERTIGHALPDDVRAVLALNDGQVRYVDERGLLSVTPIPTLQLLSTERIAAEWSVWDELRKNETESALAELHDFARSLDARVKPLYTNSGWVPLWKDPVRSDYIGVDLDPAEGGAVGQCINFGRDEDRHYVCAGSYADLLALLLEEVEAGDWPLSQIVSTHGESPWLGEPGSHFFNALYETWKAEWT